MDFPKNGSSCWPVRRSPLIWHTNSSERLRRIREAFFARHFDVQTSLVRGHDTYPAVRGL